MSHKEPSPQRRSGQHSALREQILRDQRRLWNVGSTPDSVEIVRDGATSSDGFWNVPQRASVWGSIAIGAVAVAGWVAAFVGGLAVAYAASLIR